MINYETIKEIARTEGLTVKDLCALAPINDPFYTGRPSELAAAKWFYDLWQQFGYADGVHLRRVHYRIVSQDPPVKRPDGLTYQNTEKDWNYLCNAGKWARYLGYVSPAAFVDRRNPDAILNARWLNPDDYDYEDPAPNWEVADGWGEYDDSYYALPDLPELRSLPWRLPRVPSLASSGYTSVQQAIHVELWVEKTTMNDVLEPLCRNYRVNLVTGAGELSITSVVDFLARVRAANRPARILYVSDYDPAGLGMPISIARKIEFFLRNDEANNFDIRLQPIALIRDQVDQYNLPRVPVKESDRRKAAWEASQGEGAVELDALEALYPGSLAAIVEDAILQHYDRSLDRRAREALDELTQALGDERSQIVADYQDRLEALTADYDNLKADWSDTQDRFSQLVEPFKPELEAHRERLEDITDRTKNIYADIVSDLEMIDVDPPEQPQADLPLEGDDVLYTSERDYFDQLNAYKLHRGNGTDE